jgi:hypothetical protein
MQNDIQLVAFAIYETLDPFQKNSTLPFNQQEYNEYVKTEYSRTSCDMPDSTQTSDSMERKGGTICTQLPEQRVT